MQMELIEVESAVRGYHVYQSISTPTSGETLVCKRDMTQSSTYVLQMFVYRKF